MQPLICRNDSESQGREWQAQYFASCLLMPQYILVKMQEDKDLTKWSHLYEMAEQLGVTISNLTHRLKDLDWIEIAEGSKQIKLGEKRPTRQLYGRSPMSK
ncbi:MAG: ImmA/IrrE family metallo-endopeptidase [Spirulinaceae cyanobacterium]